MACPLLRRTAVIRQGLPPADIVEHFFEFSFSIFPIPFRYRNFAGAGGRSRATGLQRPADLTRAMQVSLVCIDCLEKRVSNGSR
jgi:hypothetical protein